MDFPAESTVFLFGFILPNYGPSLFSLICSLLIKDLFYFSSLSHDVN